MPIGRCWPSGFGIQILFARLGPVSRSRNALWGSEGVLRVSHRIPAMSRRPFRFPQSGIERTDRLPGANRWLTWCSKFVKRSFVVPFRCFAYPVQSARRFFRSLRAGHGRLSRVSLGLRPFLHELRRWLAFLLLVVHHCSLASSILCLLSDFPSAYMPGLRPQAFLDRTARGMTVDRSRDLPGFRA